MVYIWRYEYDMFCKDTIIIKRTKTIKNYLLDPLSDPDYNFIGPNGKHALLYKKKTLFQFGSEMTES